MGGRLGLEGTHFTHIERYLIDSRPFWRVKCNVCFMHHKCSWGTKLLSMLLFSQTNTSNVNIWHVQMVEQILVSLIYWQWSPGEHLGCKQQIIDASLSSFSTCQSISLLCTGLRSTWQNEGHSANLPPPHPTPDFPLHHNSRKHVSVIISVKTSQVTDSPGPNLVSATLICLMCKRAAEETEGLTEKTSHQANLIFQCLANRFKAHV